MPISVSRLSFSFSPDRPIFTDLNLLIPDGFTTLVGANGAGKTTLLKLIAGQLQPLSGSVQVDGAPPEFPAVGYLPQLPESPARQTVAEALRIAPQLAALDRIEAGQVNPEDFDVVGEDWDIQERSVALLAQAGLPEDLQRPLSQLSGGERTMVGLVAQLIHHPQVLLLDEPTTNLDAPARQRLQQMLHSFLSVPSRSVPSRCAVVVSHDLDLLEQADRTVEVYAGGVRTFGGPYSHYRQVIAQEQEALRQSLTDAKKELRKRKTQAQAAETAAARRAKAGKRAAANGKVPPIVAGLMKQAAEATAGKSSLAHRQAVEQAQQHADEVWQQKRNRAELRMDMPDPALPSGKVVVEDAQVKIAGPSRVRVTGRNGAGKTTLIRRLIRSGAFVVPWALVEQDISFADESLSVVEFVRDARSDCEISSAHAHCARFLFAGDDSKLALGALSGGQRLRAVLAKALFQQPTPQLLVVDEPTNHLDLPSIEVLSAALAEWKGALLFVTHDEGFARRMEPYSTVAAEM